MRRWLGSSCVAIGALIGAACEGDRLPPTAPSPPPGSPGVPSTVAVRVEGRVIDAETREPVTDAAVTLVQFASGNRYRGVSEPGWRATTDATGAFGFTADLPLDWRELLLQVDRDGYERTQIYADANSVNGSELRLLRTLAIRPGQSVDLHVFLGSYVCGFEGHLCRRVLIESAGESMDLEVIPADSQRKVGLFVGPEGTHPFSVTSYQQRVTVSGGEVWIYAGGAERTGEHSGVLGVFEQPMTLRASRH